MNKLIQPLSTMVPIVDDDGKPTAQFARTLQRLAVSSNLSVTNGKIDVAAIAAHMVMANKTAGSAAPTACTISDILDFLTTTRGSILFRGASGWQALAPGTALNVLQTNGPGADPTWVTPASGSAAWDFLPPTAASFSLSSGDATNLTLTNDTNTGLLVGYGAFSASYIIRNAYKTLTTKALDWTLVSRIRRTHEARNFRGEGLIIIDSISGKNITFELRNDLGLSVFEWTNLAGGFSATVYSNQYQAGTVVEWQRIIHTGGNYLFDVSPDGKNWLNITSIADTAFTTNRADRVGFMGSAQNTGGPPLGFTIPYWSLTGPGV